MSCVNEKCNENPLNSLWRVVVNVDGDMACCPECAENYRKQRDQFLNVTIQDDKLFEQWLCIPL
jgi:hypothetical protein